MPNFHHTPLTAAKALRALVERDIPKTLEDIEAQNEEVHAIPARFRGLSGRWMNAYKAYVLVKEQCNGLSRIPGQKPRTGPTYSGEEIQLAIQQVFPELFADYVEKLFEQEKLTLTK